jgi:PAS domain S-box-containing protein
MSVPQSAPAQMLSVLEDSKDGFIAVNTNWEITYLNHTAELLIGIHRNVLLGLNLWKKFADEAELVFDPLYQKLISYQESTHFEHFVAFLHKWFEFRFYPSEEGFLIYFHDITILKEAEATIQKAVFHDVIPALTDGPTPYLQGIDERDLQTIIARNMAEGVCLVKVSDLTILYANPKFERMFGYQPGELYGQPVYKLNYQGAQTDPQATAQNIVNMLVQQGDATCETHNVKKDGTPFWCRSIISSYDHPQHGSLYVNVQQDITAQKEAKIALQQQNELYTSLLESLSEGIVTYAMDGRIMTCNASAERILGLSEDEITGRTSLDPRWHTIHEDGSLFTAETHPAMLTLNTGQPCRDVVMGVYKPDGSLVWVLINSQPLFKPEDTSGKHFGVVASFADITAYKEAEKTLRESEAHFRTILHSAPLSIIVTRRDSTFVEVNPKFCQLTGYQPEELYTRNIREVLKVPPEIHARLMAQLQEQGYAKDFEVVIHTKQDEARWVLVSLEAVMLGGQPYTVGTLLDITERKHAEEARKRYKLLVENTLDIILFLRPNGSIFEANRAAALAFGYSVEELQRLNIRDLRAPETVHQVAFELQKANTLGIMFETQHRRKDGSIFPCEVSSHGTDLDNERVLLSVIRDITAQKETEKALSQSEELFRSILVSSPMPIVVTRHDSTFRMVNSKFCQLTGYQIEELLEHTSQEILNIPPDIHANMLNQLQQQGYVREVEHIIYTKQGEARWVAVFLEAITLDGEVCAVGTLLDITERKRAEAELQWKEALLSSMSGAAPLAFLVVDSYTDRILYFNHRLCEMWGLEHLEEQMRQGQLTLGQIALHSVKLLTDPDSFMATVQPLQWEETQAVFEDEIPLKDGRIIRFFSSQVCDPDGRYFGRLYLFEDVTEQQKMVEERLKISKLESVGLLAGGIAHDFNNLLATLVGNIELARLSAEAAPPELRTELLKYLEEAAKVALYSRDVTAQLLTFAEGGVPVKKIASLNQLIQDAVQFALHNSTVQCQFDLPSDLWPVEIDTVQISRVVQNLVINAVQAMPGGGDLRISGENVKIPQDYQAEGLTAGNKYVRLTFQDQGVGIAPQHMSKIFDPYFTTKAKASGLGLAVCYAIIKKHGGLLTAESVVGKGTTFYAYLPVSNVSVQDSPPTSKKNLKFGKGRLLLMDDEVSLLQVTQGLLKRLGYEVEIAADGQQAVDLYRQAMAENRPFNLVLLDLVVPGGMGGKPTIEQLRLLDPQVKAIVCSGYSDDPIMANYTDYGFLAALPKPYRLGEMSNLLYRFCSPAN